MVLNTANTVYLGDGAVQKIFLGENLVWPTLKTFNISWNTNGVKITAYDPLVNENDRPRINTFRTDGNFVVYMSAGYILYNPYTYQDFILWGDRTTGIEDVSIPLYGNLSAGVDIFTDDRLPLPYLIPSITNWISSNTVNPNEIKYQYVINKNSNSIQNIFVGLYPISPPINSQLIDFQITTSSGNIFVEWGDGTSEFINSDTATNHDYFCSNYSILSGFWNNIIPCV